MNPSTIIAGMAVLLILSRVSLPRFGSSSGGRSGGSRRSASHPRDVRPSSRDGGLTARLESGEITGDALRELMGSGQLRIKRNPAPIDERKLGPAERRDLDAARRMSTQFHGEELILDLAPSERQASRFAVALGTMPALEYEPRPGSARSGSIWRHESGDRGDGAKKSRAKPLLAVDARTGRPMIVPMDSPMKLDSRRGLVG